MANTSLTARQQEILDLIKQHIGQTGYPPTRAEIATELGFKSPNAAEEHLRALARKGMIEMISGASRGILFLRQKTLRTISTSGPTCLTLERTTCCVFMV